MEPGSDVSWPIMEILLWSGGVILVAIVFCVVLGLRRKVVVFRSYGDAILVISLIGGTALLYILLFLFEPMLPHAGPAIRVAGTLVVLGGFVAIISRTHADNGDEWKTVAALIAKFGVGCLAVFVVWRLWDSASEAVTEQSTDSGSKFRQLATGAFVLALVALLVNDVSDEPRWAAASRRILRRRDRKKPHWLLEKVE